MPNKALTIEVNSAAIPNGSLDKWKPLDNTAVFIKNIITPKLNEKTNIGQLVSGIPTAFARVDLFKTALDHVGTSADDALPVGNNLISYYSRLVDEWKGLIACMALDYAHISVRRIDLAYSDGKDTVSTANVYEPKGAFGNMLLRRKRRWCDQTLTDNQAAVPYINVIKYRNTVVGATAPESLLFTSTGYKCEPSEERPWIDVATGKFIDPLKSSMKPIQIAMLHAYVNHLLRGLGKVQNYYQNLPAGEGVSYTSIQTLLQRWRDELAERADKEGLELTISSIPPVSAAFSEPFGQLFCHKDILFGLEGVISESPVAGSVQFDPKDLLLEESARIARLDINISEDNFKNLPILVLTADVKGMNEKAYFALPLSAQGLNVFGKNMAALVGMSGTNSAIKSTLKATFDPAARKDNLEVILTIVTNTGISRPLKKVYTSDGEIKNKDMLIWPNFISPQWKEYYMYNELPHNGTSSSYRAFPFVGEMQDGYFRIIVDKDKNPVLLSKDGKITVAQDDAKLLIVSGEAVADNPYKYEIYSSKKPYKGVRLQSPTGNEGGYLIINYSSAQGTNLPHDWMLPGSHPGLKPVRLGVDFGSTNTSIAYSIDNSAGIGFEFGNQRVSLLGKELPGCKNIPRENQVFFFQGAGPKVKSNAIKSVLTLHDYRRLRPFKNSGESIKERNEQAVVGGFPSFADNLPFANSDKNIITLRYPNGVGEVTQIHNMKWEDTDDAKAHKSAFLRTLMLQVYATLFEKGLVPESVKWSYPSAMFGQILTSYSHIWDSLQRISPVFDNTGKQIPLNVSSCAVPCSIGDAIGSGDFDDNGSGAFDGFDTGDFGGDFGVDSNGDTGFQDNDFGGDFGDNGSFSGGFDDNAAPRNAGAKENFNADDFLPDNPNREVRFNPEIIYKKGNSNPSMSEAEAVANYIVSKCNTSNLLTLCFDIGGSTTDISALFQLDGKVTMIKQNSIRFAAQRVSQSVSKIHEFKRVLTETCSRYGIEMVGLNFGPDTYSPNTAPYFFDQVVNRLNDAQLESFYKSISADCPKLMSVNLYVTGLLMYYAGQVARRLIDDLLRTPDTEWTGRQKPKVRVVFAGKGSRLFQWLDTCNSEAARKYYGNLFIMGYGKEHLMNTLRGWQDIILPKLNEQNDIKYEVSMGLAKGDTNLYRPKESCSSEIIGETGFDLMGLDNVRRNIDFTNTISPQMISQMGHRLCPGMGPQVRKFTEFCGFYYKASHALCNWPANPYPLEQACKDMNIVGYTMNLPEFIKAQNEAQRGNQFSFVAPVIILEGMNFYENSLMRLLNE